MSKMMSVFEKLNLVEKVGTEAKNKDNLQEELKVNEKEIEEAFDYNDENQVTRNDYIDNYDLVKNKKFESNMTVNEIYSAYDIENSNINTVFMLGNFINALPENLPYEIKKKTVMNIINASNTDLNKLIADGERRLNALKQFSDDFYSNIEASISGYNTEIAKLTALIENYKEQISIKTAMLEEQNHEIKYEAQKIDSIINFFSNGD